MLVHLIIVTSGFDLKFKMNSNAFKIDLKTYRFLKKNSFPLSLVFGLAAQPAGPPPHSFAKAQPTCSHLSSPQPASSPPFLLLGPASSHAAVPLSPLSL